MKAGVAVLQAIEPPRQVTSLGLPDRLVAFTYTLEEENGGTRVTVTMSGPPSLPEDAVRERMAPSGAAWEMALANLKAYVEGRELPYRQGLLAAIFGYRRESKEKFSVERSIWIAASSRACMARYHRPGASPGVVLARHPVERDRPGGRRQVVCLEP